MNLQGHTVVVIGGSSGIGLGNGPSGAHGRRRAGARRAHARTARQCRAGALADIAALAVHVMSNGAITGATLDIDGGQQLIAKVTI